MAVVRAVDVAELAGVSRSAVSRAFSKNASISEETRDRVFAAAAKLGYRPNGIASSLAKRESPIVAIVANNTPDMREPYFYQALLGALQEVSRIPLIITVSPDDTGETSLESAIRFPLETAIVLADSVQASTVARFCRDRRPIMLNENSNRGDRVDMIRLNERPGIKAMLDNLYQSGRRSFWLISGRSTCWSFATRRIALLEGLAANGMSLKGEDAGDFAYEGGAEAFDRLMTRSSLPDALFCTNDAMAMGAMDAARYRHGLAVPQDLGVVGFDDIPQASWPTYQLSTIRQSTSDLVDKIILMLNRRVDGLPDEPATVEVQTTFIQRASSGDPVQSRFAEEVDDQRSLEG